MENQSNKEFLYRELSYNIIGVLIEVHKELGCFAREKQYGDLFESKWKEKFPLSLRREVRVGDSGNILDFIVDEKVVLEFKAAPLLLIEHYDQVKRYLQQTGFNLGILVNFRDKRIKPKRVLNANNITNPAQHL